MNFSNNSIIDIVTFSKETNVCERLLKIKVNSKRLIAYSFIIIVHILRCVLYEETKISRHTLAFFYAYFHFLFTDVFAPCFHLLNLAFTSSWILNDKPLTSILFDWHIRVSFYKIMIWCIKHTGVKQYTGFTFYFIY